MSVAVFLALKNSLSQTASVWGQVDTQGKILVLQYGEVIEYGTQSELLKLKGLYHTLHELQFQDARTTPG